ncbi:unnamed protein product [Amoebophrya sp. A25]|nr:unnamed protein product [Amoebophrya sp. A25]|eukprot:GSA25T00002076001.1
MPLRYEERLDLRLPSMFDEIKQKNSVTDFRNREASSDGTGRAPDHEELESGGFASSRTGSSQGGGTGGATTSSVVSVHGALSSDAASNKSSGALDIDSRFNDVTSPEEDAGLVYVRSSHAIARNENAFADLLNDDCARAKDVEAQNQELTKQADLSKKIEDAMRIFVLTSQMQDRAIELERSKTGF